jgi:hypothetical protein
MVLLSVRLVNGPGAMTKTQFYGRCFWLAVKSGYALASLASLVATAVCGFLAYQHPAWGNTVTLLVWIVPLMVFLGTAIVAWTLAPYVMYRELEKSLSSALLAAQERLQAMKSAPISTWRRAELGDVKECLHGLFEACPRGAAATDWSKFLDWYAKTATRLREVLRKSKAEQFDSVAQLYISGPFSDINRAENAFDACEKWLGKARREVLADEINPEFRIRTGELPVLSTA